MSAVLTLPVKTEKESLDVHPEVLMISVLVNNGTPLAAEDLGITPAFFHAYEAAYTWLVDYGITHRSIPTQAELRVAFPNFPALVQASNLTYAAEALRIHHAKVAVMTAMRATTAILRSDDIAQAVSYLTRACTAVSDGLDCGYALTDSETLGQQAFQTTQARAEQPTQIGIPTGHDFLDQRTDGWSKGDLYIFAARLGAGKTWMLVHSATEAILAGRKVLFFSLEQPAQQIIYRFHTAIAQRWGLKLSNWSLRTGKGIDLLEYSKFLDLANPILKENLVVNDQRRGRITPLTVAAQTGKHWPDLVAIDYLTLLGASSGKKITDDWRVAADVSGDLTEMAQRFAVPVIAAAQVNREGANTGHKAPRASTISQTDMVAMDAAGVVTMGNVGKRARVFSLEKYRHGESGGRWYTKWEPDTATFDPISYELAASMAAEDECDYV